MTVKKSVEVEVKNPDSNLVCYSQNPLETNCFPFVDFLSNPPTVIEVQTLAKPLYLNINPATTSMHSTSWDVREVSVNINVFQISVPLRHITKHDIRMIPNEPRRDLPAINAEPAPHSPAGDIVVGAQADTKGALSPTSAVRGIFPTSKSRSLKKKSSILASKYTLCSSLLRHVCAVFVMGVG